LTNQITDLSLGRAAGMAGFGYLIIFISGIFANFMVIQNMIVPGDAAATAGNIMAAQGLFRLGILSFIIMVLFDLLLAWLLYLLLKPVNRDVSLFAGWLRLVNATIFGLALYHLLGVSQMVNGADYLSVFTPGQLHARIMLSLAAFNHTWLIGLIFFGFHLLLLGYLIIKSGYIPKILGILLIIAAFGYLIDSFASFLLANYADFQTVFMLIVVVPGIIGELSFTIWLIWKGGKLAEIKT
jgi:hypothetical protein